MAFSASDFIFVHFHTKEYQHLQTIHNHYSPRCPNKMQYSASTTSHSQTNLVRDTLDDLYMTDDDSDGESTKTVSSTASFRSALDTLGSFKLSNNPSHAIFPENTTLNQPLSDEHNGEGSGARDISSHEYAFNPADMVTGRNTDLVNEIRGMFRILDLVNEQGSGGLGM